MLKGGEFPEMTFLTVNFLEGKFHVTKECIDLKPLLLSLLLLSLSLLLSLLLLLLLLSSLSLSLLVP